MEFGFKKITQKINPILTGVVHHYWYNNSKPNEQYYFIEWLELFFSDGDRIIFHRDEESGIIEIVNVSIKQKSEEIQNEFNGKITIKSMDCSETEWWKDIINNQHLTIVEDPVIEEIAYPQSLLLKTPQASMLICPAEEEGINLERFVED